MGRQLKRVPLDFKWPLNKVWEGFDNKLYDRCRTCGTCGGLGLSPWAKKLHDQWYGNAPFRPEDIGLQPLEHSHPEIMKFARRQVERSPGYYGHGEEAVVREAHRLASIHNARRGNFLTQPEIDIIAAADGFRSDYTKVFDENGQVVDRTEPLTPEIVTSIAVSSSFADIGYAPLLPEMEKELGSCRCSACDGEGSVWESEEARLAAEEWEPTEPPEGEGWQLWETVSEGSPVSPVFATAEELADWLASPESSEADGVNRGTSRSQWLAFLHGPGWAPSMIVSAGRVMGGVEAVVADQA